LPGGGHGEGTALPAGRRGVRRQAGGGRGFGGDGSLRRGGTARWRQEHQAESHGEPSTRAHRSQQRPFLVKVTPLAGFGLKSAVTCTRGRPPGLPPFIFVLLCSPLSPEGRGKRMPDLALA